MSDQHASAALLAETCVAALFEPREAEVSSEPQSVPHSDAA